jgi:hypothetical protein
MFGQIKVIVDLISVGLKDGWSLKGKVQRRADVLRMLETYFLLKDCLDEGCALIEEAGSKPVEKIRNMPDLQAEAVVRRWDYILRRQGRRLAILQGHLIGQDHLTVINPDLQKRILQAIGDKFDQVTTLYGIGAALLFYSIFPLAESREEKAQYVVYMSGSSRRNTISIPRIKREVKSLSESLEQYREAINKLISSEEMVRLSKEARTNTLFKPVSEV